MSDTELEVPEGMTALYDADVPRADLVGAAANGIPRPLIAKQADGAPGLLPADYVRSLIAKSEPEPEASHAGEMVTMTGSPAAIAEMIHKAAVRQTTVDVALNSPAAAALAGSTVEKAEASTATMNDRPDSDFAYVEPGGKKDSSGKTVPRDLRHYPIYDAAHARNALGRAGAQIQNGDADAKRIARAALPKIRAAAKKFGIDVAKAAQEDGMDPTVILAEPDDDAPGDPTDPGSPAWESIDAATARKWTAILARARSALGIMADREGLEAASADPGDADHAMDMEDAACAIDYAIGLLAPFAVDEQAEADCGADEMEMVGKAAAAIDAGALETVEALAPLTKAGRTLSAANESALRTAIQQLQQIIASLPKAPDAPEAAGGGMQKESQPMGDNTEAVQAALDSSHMLGTTKEPADAERPAAAGMPGQVAKGGKNAKRQKKTAKKGGNVQKVAKAKKATKAQAEKKAEPGVAKAAKPDQMAVYDDNGNLVGVVDPSQVTRLMSAKAPAPAETGPGAGTDGTPDDAQPAAQQGADDGTTPTDLAPAPAGAVGTPADAVQAADDGNVAKATDTETTGTPSGGIHELVKAAIDDYSAGQADVIKGLKDQNRMLQERLATLENAPAVMAIASNGAVPPAHMLRGQDRGGHADLSGSALLKAKFNASDDAREQKAIAEEMQQKAIDAFGAMRRR